MQVKTKKLVIAAAAALDMFVTVMVWLLVFNFLGTAAALPLLALYVSYEIGTGVYKGLKRRQLN
jgi:hypothetical protein